MTGSNFGIRGVTYSTFDNHVGTQLLYSYPDNVLSTDFFEQVSDYAIVGTHLCEKVIIVKIGDIQFLNYSVEIENSKYFRNKILFSLGFVLDENVVTDPFEKMLKKICETFVTLEVKTFICFNLLYFISLDVCSLNQNFYFKMKQDH